MPICMARPGPYELYVQYETAETSEDEAIAGPTWQLVAWELRVWHLPHFFPSNQVEVVKNRLPEAVLNPTSEETCYAPRSSLCCAGLLVVHKCAVPRCAG